MLGEAIRLRLAPSTQLFFEQEAARAQMPLSRYLRNRLEGLANWDQELAMLRQLLLEQHPSSTAASGSNAVILESLLLLRQLASPQMLRLAQSEVARSGLGPWEAGDAN